MNGEGRKCCTRQTCQGYQQRAKNAQGCARPSSQPHPESQSCPRGGGKQGPTHQQQRAAAIAAASAPVNYNPSGNNSAQILFVEPNFTETPSEFETFYDCNSELDVEECPSLAIKAPAPQPECNRKEIANRRDPSFLIALQKIASLSQKIIADYSPPKSKHKPMKYKEETHVTTNGACCRKRESQAQKPQSCHMPHQQSQHSPVLSQPLTINVDINARITNNGGSNTIHMNPYTIRIEPVAFTVPLKLNLQTGHLTPMSVSRTAMSHIAASTTACNTHPCIEPIRTATITGASMDFKPVLPAFACAFQPSAALPCPAPVPAPVLDTGDEHLKLKKLPCPCKKKPIPPPPKPEPEPEYEPEPEPPPPPPPPQKKYRLAYPQHKYLDLCSPCRFDPSPLIDETGRIFCPRDCGCCLCPWQPRASLSQEDRLKHQKIKVCRCREKGSIFTEFNTPETKCSVTSYFDVCVCREKAEAKHLELFGCEMWTKDEELFDKFRGVEVEMDDVVEIRS